MKKILSLFALLMLVLQYSMAGTATFNLGSTPGSMTPAGFFTHGDGSNSQKWNFNSKFNGGEYDGITFSNGLKMEGSTFIKFTTDKISTVTIVQSTSSGSDKTINFDGNALEIINATSGTGCRIYTIEGVDAGEHSITRGSGEAGLFYVKVEWDDEYTALYDNSESSSWNEVYAYAWSGTAPNEVKMLGDWPGTKLAANNDGKYPVTITTGLPENIIFNNGSGGQGNQTATFVFKDGGQYNFNGLIKTAYTATFTTEATWEHVYAYCKNETTGEEALGAFPGTEITATEGVYSVSIEAEELPDFIRFSDGTTSQVTPDYDFEDNGAYAYNKSTYTVTFTTNADWDKVCAWIWSGNVNLLEEPWPGKQLTADADGVYTFTYSGFIKPEGILFNNGETENTQKTPDYTFEDGKRYEYVKNTYTAYLVTDADWDKVCAWTWTGSGNNTVNHLQPWPGLEISEVSESDFNLYGLKKYSLSYQSFDKPENILFDDGNAENPQKTPDFVFVEGKTYKYLTATPIYALSENNSFEAGTTIDVKDGDEDVVATITYGDGGEKFKAAKEYNLGYLGYAGFTAYTEGNGTNGNASNGTYYTITPKFDGTLIVAVALNANKAFHVQVDGADLADFNGIKESDKYYGTYEFAVTGGKSYKFWCDDSKLGFFGFDYKFTKTISDCYLVGGTSTWSLEETPMTTENGVYVADIPYDPEYSFAIVPNTSINGETINWKSIIRPASQTEIDFVKITGNASTTNNSQNWKMRDLIADGDLHFGGVKFSYDTNDGIWTVEPYADVEIGSTGYATYSTAYKYKVSGATANFVTVDDKVAKLVPQAADDILPAGSGKHSGIILEGDANSKATIWAVEAEAEAVDASANLLAGSGNYSYGITGNFGNDPYTAYIFAAPNGKVGFYILNGDDSTLPAHKAFLAAPVSAGVRDFIGFEDVTTGVESVHSSQYIVHSYYNLNGQRVAQPTKGLYIVNGKKVVIK